MILLCTQSLETCGLYLVDPFLLRDMIGYNDMDELIYLAVDVTLMLHRAWSKTTKCLYEPFLMQVMSGAYTEIHFLFLWFVSRV